MSLHHNRWTCIQSISMARSWPHRTTTQTQSAFSRAPAPQLKWWLIMSDTGCWRAQSMITWWVSRSIIYSCKVTVPDINFNCVSLCFSFLFYRVAGMQAIFEIKKCFPNVHKPRPHGEVRQYFIAAEEDVWDYSPTIPSEGSVIENTHTHSHKLLSVLWSCFCDSLFLCVHVCAGKLTCL